ncbi:hypothetical protein [Pseudoduganella violaceinigra]|uniref:hypothetical protein n=1 Tax=Pseudoduganella violaceinigra TaxID=246602 RepID=UPI00040D5BC8|nr:hypothetical protein [Pseudoduganella violaceinigra]
MFPHRLTRRFITLLLLLYVAMQSYAAAAQATMPMMDHAACAAHHEGNDQRGMADCFVQCSLCGAPAVAPGFGQPSIPVPHDLTGPRTAIIAAQHDGESHLPHQARGPPAAV